MGHYPVPDNRVYDQAYFDKYVSYAATARGKALLEARLELLASVWLPGDRILDVGVGCGAFVEACREIGVDCLGYDCNPAAVRWLRDRELWGQLRSGAYQTVTFWDALEHLEDPWSALRCAGRAALVSVPLESSGEAWLGSKHFRKDEHRWYWSRNGFERFAESCGFVVRKHCTVESALGRQNIHTFSLVRRKTT